MQDKQLQIEDIQEDILVIGGGPAGGLIGHVFGNIYGYRVRIIERNSDLTDSSIKHEDKSGNYSMSYRTQNAFYKFGLREEINGILNPVDKFGLVMDNQVISMDFIPHTKVVCLSTSRRELQCILNRKNKESSNIEIEFETKVVSVDMENKVIETVNMKSNIVQKRRFKFIIGADGYNSQVRKGMEKVHGKQAQIDEYPQSLKNTYLPNYQQWLAYQEGIKQGKYPWYDKLDDKYKKNRKLCGQYIMDPSILYAYGVQNLWVLGVPIGNGVVNLCFGMGDSKGVFQEFAERHPELKERICLEDQFLFNYQDLDNEEKIHDFLVKHVPYLYGLCPDLVEQFKNQPVFKSRTVFCDNWYLNGDACLLGDACNAMNYQSASGLNVTMENISVFFDIFSRKVGDNKEAFLKDGELRKGIFQEYQNTQFKGTRANQESDIQDAVFPSISYAAHPKFPLFMGVEQHLLQEVPDIYLNKINQTFLCDCSLEEAQGKAKIFSKYILAKIMNVEKFEDIDLKNCRQELTELLEKENLPVKYTFKQQVLQDV